MPWRARSPRRPPIKSRPAARPHSVVPARPGGGSSSSSRCCPLLRYPLPPASPPLRPTRCPPLGRRRRRRPGRPATRDNRVAHVDAAPTHDRRGGSRLRACARPPPPSHRPRGERPVLRRAADAEDGTRGRPWLLSSSTDARRVRRGRRRRRPASADVGSPRPVAAAGGRPRLVQVGARARGIRRAARPVALHASAAGRPPQPRRRARPRPAARAAARAPCCRATPGPARTAPEVSSRARSSRKRARAPGGCARPRPRGERPRREAGPRRGEAAPRDRP